MLKGTPLGALLEGIGTLYWLVVISGAVLILVQDRSLRSRLIRLCWFVVILIGPVLLIAIPSSIESRRSASRLAESLALFAERCKSAGEKIDETIEEVDGVVWTKWRNSSNRDDQFALDDPYGADCSGEGCILNLLRVTENVDRNPQGAAQHNGMYEFVEAFDLEGNRVRYIAEMRFRQSWSDDAVARHLAKTGTPPPPDIYIPGLRKQPIPQFSARYGIAWEDVSTKQDREHWIAGGALKIVDLRTGREIARRTGYMIDTGQGDISGGRSPWAFATSNACPAFLDPASGKRSTSNRAQSFAFRVLKPAP